MSVFRKDEAWLREYAARQAALKADIVKNPHDYEWKAGMVMHDMRSDAEIAESVRAAAMAPITSAKVITCVSCAAIVPKTGAMQRYCTPCSEKRDLERKRLNDQSPWTRVESVVTANGIEISKRERSSIGYTSEAPDLLWLVRVAVPFSYSASKNAIYTMRRSGHVALRKEAKAWRYNLRDKLREAIAGQTVVQNKVWLDILVEKTNHKGDAINVLDTVGDAVKEAIGVDDRWYCIRHLDWRISKHEPRLILGVGQDSTENLQACSSCGRLLPFTEFGKKSNTKHKIDRNCKACRKGS